MCATEKSQISREILAYLAEHPDAEDTLEGIGEWWLLEQKIKQWTLSVREALADLVASGWILERRDTDSRSRYRVNRQRWEEIRALFEDDIRGRQ